MGKTTGIEWTDSTWNPLRGCSRVSEGCRNCYAEKMAARFSGPGQPYEGLAVMQNGKAHWTGKVELVEKHLLDPLKWKPGRPVYDAAGKRVGRDTTQSLRIFVNSISDLFHESVPEEWIDRIFAVMALCPQHTFQVLTTRPERMRKYFADPRRRTLAIIDEIADICCCLAGYYESDCVRLPPPNVWLGVSVENQAAADERIPLLLQTPAAVRFISAEPLLGPVDMASALSRNRLDIGAGFLMRGRFAPGLETLRPLDWVICGGESGPGARPMHPDWARSLRDQCAAAGLPFFFKQWGEWAPTSAKPVFGDHMGGGIYLRPDGHYGNHGDWWFGNAAEMDRVGKKAAGALLDGVEHKAFPARRQA
jgi:protein gp37